MNTVRGLTGGGGSIGVHLLCHLLKNTDDSIVAIDSFRHKGEFDRIAFIMGDHPEWRKRVKVITHDLTAPFSTREIKELQPITHLYHLASLSDVQASIDDPVPFIKNNVDLTVNTLELSRQLENLTYVGLFSTDESKGPAAIDQGHKEWDPTLPSNPYAASKAAQEDIAIAYWRSYDLPLVITQTMNNYGEMQQASKYPVKIQKAVANGEKVTVHAAGDGQIGTRFYIHSRNASDALLFLSQRPVYRHKPGEVDRPDRYNIVGERQVSNLELAQLIADLMGKPLNYELVDFHSKQPGHDLHYGLDGSKLADLGWKAPVDFETSLENTIRWQSEHPEWIQ